MTQPKLSSSELDKKNEMFYTFQEACTKLYSTKQFNKCKLKLNAFFNNNWSKYNNGTELANAAKKEIK